MDKLPLSVRVWGVPTFGVVLAAIISLCLWLHRSAWYPPVGTFIAILAFLGVLMPLFRDVTKIGRGEKAFWTAIMFALVLLEIRSLYRDRTDLETKEQRARDEQLKGFQKVGEGIEGAIKQSQDNFTATMGELSTNLNTLTGADSSCYLATINPTDPYLFFVHIGNFPLYEVGARIVQLDHEGKIIPGRLIGVTVSVGDMIKGHGNMRSWPNGLLITADYFNANIFFTARNGDWLELLREQKINGELVTAMRVSGRFTTLKKEQTICERIDPKFPKKPNGDIDSDFRAGPKAPRCP